MGRSNLFNVVSLVFLVLTFGMVLFVIIKFVSPAPVKVEGAVATVAVFPTLTPSNTPRPTLPPTFTDTPLPSNTPTDTATATLTPSPSPTITDTPGPTDTPSITPTPPDTATFTPTWTPTGPTPTFTPSPNPFPFNLKDNQVIFTKNTYNTAGCAWEAVAGRVFDKNGVDLPPSSGYQVHVFNTSFDLRRSVGSNSLYGGQSGWEVNVDNKINNQTYLVELETPQGTVVSPRITVTFPSDCERNVALVYFYQQR